MTNVASTPCWNCSDDAPIHGKYTVVYDRKTDEELGHLCAACADKLSSDSDIQVFKFDWWYDEQDKSMTDLEKLTNLLVRLEHTDETLFAVWNIADNQGRDVEGLDRHRAALGDVMSAVTRAMTNEQEDDVKEAISLVVHWTAGTDNYIQRQYGDILKLLADMASAEEGGRA